MMVSATRNREQEATKSRGALVRAPASAQRERLNVGSVTMHHVGMRDVVIKRVRLSWATHARPLAQEMLLDTRLI